MSAPATSTRRALLGWLVFAVAALALLALSREAGAQSGEAVPEGIEGAERGGLLYAQQCATCHGADGRGGPVPRYGGQAPSMWLDDNPNMSAAYLDLVMSTGRMPPAESPYDNRPREVVFGPDERADIIAYMADTFEVPGEVPQVGEGAASQGQDVWNTNCAHCHGSIGAGGVAGGGAWTPQVNNKSAQEIVEAIRVGPFQMPAFGEDQISDDEAASVAVFMEEAANEEGTPLGLTELNPVYASAFVAALAVLMLLSLVWIGGRPRWFPDPDAADQRPEIPAGAARRTHTTSTAGSSPHDAPSEDLSS